MTGKGTEQAATDLRQLKGIGAILAGRLLAAGLDTFEKLAEAGEEGLAKIRGITPRAAGSIAEQARGLSQPAQAERPESREKVKKQLHEVRQKVRNVALLARERFEQDLAGKKGEKLSSDLVRIEDALAQMEGVGRKRAKGAGKALRKAEKRLAGLEDASVKKVRKGLKRVRKAVHKVGR